MPQPNFVPVSLSVSRKTHNRGVSGSTSTVCGIPFTTTEIAISFPPVFAPPTGAVFELAVWLRYLLV
jgi:hypothetical protein